MSEVTNTNRILNVIPSKDTQNDWSMNTAVEAGMLSAPAALPASVDLRQDWWKIGDQGATGSCVGWGTAEGVLRLHFTNAGRVKKTETLSPRYVWMAAKETDEFVSRPTTFIEADGTSLKSALDIARKFGVVKDAVLPFKTGKLYQGDTNTFYAIASQLKIASYFNFQKNFNQWRTWLSANGPILAALRVDATWGNANAANPNLDVFQPATVRGGHCISIVGYKADGRFIVRNSWGTGWGDQGFAFASEAYIRDAFFDESYGVNL
jgi:Papain family cysteine protease